jgi:hypothetical protein
MAEEKMGRFSVEVELANDADLVQLALGQLREDEVGVDVVLRGCGRGVS